MILRKGKIIIDKFKTENKQTKQYYTEFSFEEMLFWVY